MQRALPIVLTAVVAAVLATRAHAEDAGPAARDLLAATTDAAAGVVFDDRGRVEAAVAAAEAALTTLTDARTGAGTPRRRLARQIDRGVARLDELRSLLSNQATSRRVLLRATRRVERVATHIRDRSPWSVDDACGVEIRPRRASALVRGRSVRIRARERAGAELTNSSDPPPFEAPGLPDRRGRTRLRATGAPGAVRVKALGCPNDPGLWLVVRPTSADLEDTLDAVRSPTAVTYADVRPLRVGETVQIAGPRVDGGEATSFSIAPAPPAGLTFDPATGAISGTASVAIFATDFVVTASNGSGGAEATISLEIAPALPADVEFLAPGFVAERLHGGLDVPVKLAYLPDGRLLFNELGTGRVRLIRTNGSLESAPVASLSVLTGGERGLIGLAVAPDFATTGHVLVYASTAAGDGKPERNRVLRLTLTGDAATDVEVLIDDLPIGIISNGGHLAFARDGTLHVSIGDTGVEALAQTDGSRAGRLLRFTADGAVPADNPLAGDPELCRGLRNPFAFTFHPVTGDLFISENGPTANDELNFGQSGKNFEWGGVPPDLPDFLRGFAITSWTPVIVPTGLTFPGTSRFGAGAEGDLFLGSYDLAEIRRLRLSGELRTDLDDESTFLRFADAEAIANKPLDVVTASDGSLTVSTFTAIWRVDRWAP